MLMDRRKITQLRKVLAPAMGVLVFITLSLTTHTVIASGVTLLSNSDFKFGTYIIDKPGIYRLAEDISFNPNSPATLTEALQSGDLPPDLAAALGIPNPADAYHSGFPLPTQFVSGGVDDFTPGGLTDPRYDPAGFGLGFFAAIAITATGVVLDLNEYTIEQSEEHALLQRFFAVIELAEQPFIPSQGPANFGDEIESAKKVLIKNGTIGRSSHHGIHGNGNKAISIINVNFKDYEVGAVALNGVEGLVIKNSNASNRKDVPVLGTFSSAQFIKPYIEELDRNNSTTVLDVNGIKLSVDDIKAKLIKAINNTHHDLIVERNTVDGRPQIDKNENPAEFALFGNPFGVVDGNSYSYLVNNFGVAVNGFPTRPNGVDRFPAKNIWLHNVHVNNQKAFINEIVALNQGGKAVIDPVGAVFQTRNLDPETGDPITVSSLNNSEAKYIGNVVANAQAFVAKAHLNGDFDTSNLDLSRLNITETVLKWVEAKPGFETLSSIVKTENDYLCNGDSMFHVNKGVIAFKMDAAKNVVLHKTSAQDIGNLGDVGSDVCGDYSGGKSHPDATLLGYGGAKTRGYTFAGSRNVFAFDSHAEDLSAKASSVTGLDVFTDSKGVHINKALVKNVSAGLDGPSTFSGPNETPTATGIHIGKDAKKISIARACAELLMAFGDESIIDDESGAAKLRKICQ